MRVELEVRYMTPTLRVKGSLPFYMMSDTSQSFNRAKLCKSDSKLTSVIKDTLILSEATIQTILSSGKCIWDTIPCSVVKSAIGISQNEESFLELIVETDNTNLFALTQEDLDILNRQIEVSIKDSLDMDIKYLLEKNKQKENNFLNEKTRLQLERNDLENEVAGFKFLSFVFGLTLAVCLLFFM